MDFGLPRNARFLRALAALGSCALLLGGCSRESHSVAPASAHTPRVLSRGVGPEPDSMDPQRALSSEAQGVLRDLCEGLTLLDHQAAVIPGTADSWSISDDRLTYRFHIRANSKWSNGEPVRAEDFVVGLRRLVDPATASPYAEVVDSIVNAPAILRGKLPAEQLGVGVVDSQLEIVLSAPTPYLLGLLAHPSTCPYHPLAAGSAARPGRNGIWNGAFMLTEWIHGSHLSAMRNPYYWNDSNTRLDAVQYSTVDDENAELRRYRAGELQITSTIPRAELQRAKDMFGEQVHTSPALWTEFYAFNLRRAPFKDNPKLRRALSLVIDRERLVSGILRGSGVAAYGWVPPGIQNYHAQSFDYRELPMADRIAEARRLYREAGYTARNPLRFELRYNQSPIITQVAVAVSSMWKEALGVDAALTAVEFKVLVSEIEQGETQAFRSSWSADYDDAFTYIGYLAGGSGINFPRYESAEYNALAERSRLESNESVRRGLLEQAETVALRDHALIPLYFQTNRHLVSPKVVGWYDNGINVVYSKDLALRE